MARFDNVLVLASPGQLDVRSVRRVLRVATDEQTRVTVLDVVEPVPARRRQVQIDGRLVDLQELLLRDRCEHLRRALTTLTSERDIAVQVGAGKPVVEVIRHVREFGYDLVVVGSRTPDEEGRGLDPAILQLLRKRPLPSGSCGPAAHGSCVSLRSSIQPPKHQEATRWTTS